MGKGFARREHQGNTQSKLTLLVKEYFTGKERAGESDPFRFTITRTCDCKTR